MDLSLSAEHEMLRDSVRRFADREIAPYARDWDRRQAMDPELPAKMAELGLLGVCLPERYGGAGMDYLSLGLACEELERADTAVRTVLSVHVGLNCLSLLQWGSAEQKERLLKPQTRGEKLAAFALTEPGAGSDVAALRTRAMRDGGCYVLNGEKTWISLADMADHFLLFAKVGPLRPERGGEAISAAAGPGPSAADHRTITAFVVERAMAGVRTSTIHGKLGIRAGNAGSIALTDVRVPVENRIGEEGEGFKIAMSALDRGRYTVAAGAVGTMVACLEASVSYANTRRASGEPIGRKQLVQQMIARMAQSRDIGRLLYYQVGWLMNEGRRTTRESSLAKWTNCDAAFTCANDAVEIHGAYGFCDEFPVERYLRNARGPMIYEGTREIHQLVQAEYALGYRTDRPSPRTLPPWPFPKDV